MGEKDSFEKIILASASPRRRDFLLQLGLDFEILPASINEVREEGESSIDYVSRLASEKANCLSEKHSNALVIAADTIVVLRENDLEIILEKPQDRADAIRMLTALSGKEHRVLSAYTLSHRARSFETRRTVITKITFTDLDQRTIERYVDSGEPMDKAGAYAIQGFAGLFVKEVAGSFSNVVGLPMAELIEDLRSLGAY